MANALGALFSDIADSIREKTGETGKMKPADFPAAIDGIVMKADPVLAELSVSENGLYVPGEGVDGFGSVMVNVEEGSSGSGSSLFDDILDVINGEVIGETPYTVTFIGATGEVLHSTQVLEQQNCDDPVENDTIDAPTKAPTTTKIFTYAGGWSLTDGGDINPDALKNITEDRTVYAVFTEEVRKYAIEYYDGDTLLDSIMREYGDTLADYTPEKDGYNFVAWQPEVTTVTGDAKYYAQWELLSNVIDSGTCGSSVYWELGRDYTLRIYGEGDMDDFRDDAQPWVNYRGEITSVIVEQGVTSIGKASFRMAINCTGFSLPNSITKIGKGAFYNCRSTSVLVIPENVTNIGSYAYFGCSSITNITIPSAVTQIDGYAFQTCSKLANVTFENVNGWKYYESETATTGYTIWYFDLQKSDTAATYLKTTYTGKWWKRT